MVPPSEDKTGRQFRISVSELAAFCCRRGDLHLGLERAPSAQEGQEGQRLLQQNKPAHYQREIFVSTTLQTDTFTCLLSGRIDGLQDDETPLLEEIKTTYCTRETLPDAQRNVHLAQLKLYAALYLQDHNHQRLQLQLSYLNLEDQSRFQFDETCDRDTLQAFYQDCINQYRQWLQLQCFHLEKRDAALQILPFPFPHFRPGQRALSVQAYRDLRDGHQGLYQAATGLGKTAGVLFPALKILAENGVKQIWYVTAKISGQRSVQQALERIRQQSPTETMPLRPLILTARERQCFCGNSGLETCQWQTGFYDRLPAARLAFQQAENWQANSLLQLAREFQLCPHQLTRELLPWTDLVIADYNYVFDPYARLRDYLEQEARHIALLVDEAHNLPERARDMFSTRLPRAALSQAIKACNDPLLQKQLRKVLKLFPANGSELQAEIQHPDHAPAILSQLAEAWSDWFGRQQWLVPPAELFDTMMLCLRFAQRLQKWQAEDRWLTSGETPSPYLEIFCSDPAPELQRLSSAFHSALFFSGSLLPLDFFARCLSTEPFRGHLNLPCPFPPQNQCTLVIPVNTRFENRAASAPQIAALIQQVWHCKPGHYLVSFPSYQYLQTVLEQLQLAAPELPLLAQQTGTDAATTEDFLQRFLDNENIALVIAGGSFAEGLDLPDNLLQGVIIVGTCMPPPSLQRELIRERFETDTGRGFDFAYRYPGINRVIQSAGRVIRSETDRGLVILADDRFTRSDTRLLLPAHWQPHTARHEKELTRLLQQFWSAAV